MLARLVPCPLQGRKTSGFYFVFILGLDWRVGAFHFEDVLLDYDVAMNYGNWVVVAEATHVQRPSAPFVICCLLLSWRLVMALQAYL